MTQINDRYEFPLQLDLDRDDGKYLSPDADRRVCNLYTLHRSDDEISTISPSFTVKKIQFTQLIWLYRSISWVNHFSFNLYALREKCKMFTFHYFREIFIFKYRVNYKNGINGIWMHI